MSTSVARSQSGNRRLQFSLASLFVFVTGICVALSLVRWNTTFGLLLTLLIVAGGWAVAAKRAGYYRLAYTLASAALGAFGHLALIVPMAIILNKGIWGSWFHPAAVVLMTASTVLTAAILRRAILAPLASAGIAVGSMYLTSVLFPCVWGIALMATEPQSGLIIILFGSIGGPVLATLTLPITLPLSLVFCWILRSIDPWRWEIGGAVWVKPLEARCTQSDKAEISDEPVRVAPLSDVLD
jgi:hypothetical protein